ncbi:hypothetical protein N7501_009325 [Penicillium viridicatum]|nr:hypothetical protein N7501_009325 [Penicillium viridicatum]
MFPCKHCKRQDIQPSHKRGGYLLHLPYQKSGPHLHTKTDLIARFEVLPLLLQLLIVGAIGAILIPIIAGLVLVCIMIASALGLIDWDRSGSEKQVITKADPIPDSTEKTVNLSNDGNPTETIIERKRRLEIEIDFPEEGLRARRDELAQFS